MSESEVGIVYHHELCVRIVEETLLDLVEFLLHVDQLLDSGFQPVRWLLVLNFFLFLFFLQLLKMKNAR